MCHRLLSFHFSFLRTGRSVIWMRRAATCVSYVSRRPITSIIYQQVITSINFQEPSRCDRSLIMAWRSVHWIAIAGVITTLMSAIVSLAWYIFQNPDLPFAAKKEMDEETRKRLTATVEQTLQDGFKEEWRPCLPQIWTYRSLSQPLPYVCVLFFPMLFCGVCVQDLEWRQSVIDHNGCIPTRGDSD